VTRIPIHPGETIREDILSPTGMSVNQLAKELRITPSRLNDIVLGRRGITADTALRLARYLGTTAEFSMNLQMNYELRVTRRACRSRLKKRFGRRPRRPIWRPRLFNRWLLKLSHYQKAGKPRRSGVAPTMPAGVADRVWEISDIVNLLRVREERVLEEQRRAKLARDYSVFR